MTDLSGRSLRVLTLIPACIAINVAVGQTVAVTGLPLYLDSLGTVLVAVLAGPAAGAWTGFLGTAIWSLTNPTMLPFAVVAASIGATAGGLARLGCFRHRALVLLGGALTGCVSACVAAPIAAVVYNGVTGGGTDLLVALFRAHGASVVMASLQQGLAVDPLDKAVSFLLVSLVLQALPQRYLRRFA